MPDNARPKYVLIESDGWGVLLLGSIGPLWTGLRYACFNFAYAL
jgi:hypothetical protein